MEICSYLWFVRAPDEVRGSQDTLANAGAATTMLPDIKSLVDQRVADVRISFCVFVSNSGLLEVRDMSIQARSTEPGTCRWLYEGFVMTELRRCDDGVLMSNVSAIW